MNSTLLKNAFLLFVLTFALNVYGNDVTFEVNQQHISRNYDSRVRQIVLHYTVGHFLGSLEILDGDTGRQVSSHYLINDKPNDKYPNYIYQLVPDDQRSWHAGISQWYHDTDINNSSIGIEIANLDGNRYPYPDKQMDALIFLLKKLISKYGVRPINVIGHSDIAPRRKEDPGVYFPWKKLYDNGIGAWYDDADVAAYRKEIVALPPIEDIRNHLKIYGYNAGLNSQYKDEQYRAAVIAFERHFSPKTLDGKMSLNEYLILRALNKKYRRIN